MRDEMEARKTRYYRKQLVWEIVYGTVTIIGVIAVLLFTMAVFVD